MNPDQIEALTGLLSGSHPDDDDSNPGRFGPSAPVEKNNPNAGQDPLFKTVLKTGPTSATSPAAAAAAAAKAKVDTRAIWSPEEIAAARELAEDDASDGRRKPEYDILYAQSLSTADVYMGLSGRDASSANCEAIVVKVILPGATMAEVNLDVTPTRLMVRSNEYKLFLYLPHTVNDQQGRAKWDGRKETLSITLPIVRQDDE